MPKIVIVGEAWGEEEARLGHPFVGASGRELIRMLSEAGFFRAPKVWVAEEVRDFWLTQSTFYLTNVFNFHPERNDLDTLCSDKNDGLQGFPAIRAGKYVRSEYAGELQRLYTELRGQAPNLVIALGNTAIWALLRTGAISKIRGTVSTGEGGLKVLPTYHPAAVLRDWSLRHVTVMDLQKALRESIFPDIRRPERTVYIEPSLHDLEWFYHEHIKPCRLLSIDVETSGNQITCVGFSPDPTCSLVIPFVDLRREDGNYWPTFEDEINAWDFVRRILESKVPKLFQNGLYDVSFFWRSYAIRTINAQHDTMLLHHALQPESPKGLGFLGSCYTNEASWKMMRTRAKETIKRDE